MNLNQRFSILTFPQFFDGNELSLNIVVLPRDHNPLNPAIAPNLASGQSPAFADAQLSFVARIIDGLGTFPNDIAAMPGLSLNTNPTSNSRDIFEALANHMSIVNTGMINTNFNLDSIHNDFKPEPARTFDKTIKKYLPKSYRESFNFTSPVNENAVTDDSYHCAVKEAQYVPTFERSSDEISWGRVFAYLMRQPLLAQQAGMIYQTSLSIDPGQFTNGGWLFVDLTTGSDYRAEQDADDTFIKQYAARIPALTAGEPRQVFAPILFPVTSTPTGNYDELFIEAAEFDDGFAKIVHCQQAPGRNLLDEENLGTPPVKDTGIRLGWNDEKLLLWYMRQMLEDPNGQLSDRLDAPLGVFGYIVDVRETAEPENPWESLNQVQSNQTLTLSRSPNNFTDPINLGNFTGELPYQVYPMQLDGRTDQNYWLPMYFAYWSGHNMMLPDPDAATIYQTTNVDVLADPERDFLDDDEVTQVTDSRGNPGRTGTGITGPAQNQLNQIYSPGPINTQLRYGNNYEFRVRFQDLSGGAPSINSQPVNETASDIASCRFKRFLTPNQPRILELQPSGNDDNPIVNQEEPNEISELNVQRPKIGYPAVIYTGKYTDPVQRLIDQSNLGITVDENDHSVNADHRVGLGIADPDVDRLEIVVEIASLKLDKHESISGREDYVHLYTTYRFFAAVNTDEDYESVLNIPIQYRDTNVVHSGNETDVTNDLDLPDDIDNLSEIVLPTGRTARLTIRAVCEEKENNEDYYGSIRDGSKKIDTRYGEAFQIMAYSPSIVETGLLIQAPNVPVLQGIFMQSDVVHSFDGRLTTLLFGQTTTEHVDNVQQLADRLDIQNNGLTLNAPKGQRIVFGCSSRIRHSLAPDNSSITFASKGDLINHWLVCLSFDIDRDWMWDGLRTRSFIVRRTKRFTHEQDAESTDALIGDIEMIQTASFESLDKPNRNSTRIIFIDAVEPKQEQGQNAEPAFPDTIDLSYTIEPQFKEDHASEQDSIETQELTLPITTVPSQVPKIASAGIALSPYVRNEQYSASEPRRRQLWIEFEEPVKDEKDTYFCRVLAISPDQLISSNNPALLVAPEEPAIPLDPESIRVVAPGSTNDLAGLNAMQPMQKSSTSDRHYLMPLPPGLHANADEMFGFFTYEFRVGHYEYPTLNEDDEPEKVWTTAQGRFGRRLRATGIQHPSPTLTCMANRDNEKLWVTAPYAVAVHDGKNVTADPPRTELWALLYAQVKQADNQDYRNVLLNDRKLDWRVQIETEKDINVFEKYNKDELQLLNTITVNNFSDSVNYAKFKQVYKLADFSAKNKNTKKYGTTVWSNDEISQFLDLFCLPDDSPLSVLVVEILPTITRISEHITNLNEPEIAQAAVGIVADEQRGKFNQSIENIDTLKSLRANQKKPGPLSDELGHHRILRTSPLTEVPEVCCTDC